MEDDFDYETITTLLADPENTKCRYFPVDMDMYESCRENDILPNATACVLSARSDKAVTCDDYAFDDELVAENNIYSATMHYGRVKGHTHTFLKMNFNFDRGLQ